MMVVDPGIGALSHEQELFRESIHRNMARGAGGFDGVPRPIFSDYALESGHPLAVALHSMDGVIGNPEPGTTTPVLSLAPGDPDSGKLTGQFKTAIGFHRPFSEARMIRSEFPEDGTEVATRLVKLYFQRVALLQNVVVVDRVVQRTAFSMVVPPAAQRRA